MEIGISIKRIGNLDRAIEKMKKNISCGKDEVEKLQLKCCFLFLCGMSYAQIEEQLGLSKESISLLLQSPHLEELLTFEYLTLWKLNQKRFHHEEIAIQVRKVILTFIEQNGHYQNTLTLTGLSKRVLNRYLSYPHLHEILNDETLYQKFLQMKTDYVESEQEKQAMKHRFEQELGTSINSKQSPSHETNEVLSQEEKEILELYRKGRYSYFKLCEIISKTLMLGISSSDIKILINEKGKCYLSEKEFLNLKEKTQALSHIYPPRNKELISNPLMIEIVKPEIIIVSSRQYKMLSNVVHFLVAYNNIKKCDPDDSFYQVEMNALADLPHLEPILRTEMYLNLKKYLEMEQLLLGNQLAKKYQYIMHIVKQFLLHDLSLEQTASKEDLEVSSLIRILQNEMIPLNYGMIVSEYIKNAIEQYRISYQEKENDKYVFAKYL